MISAILDIGDNLKDSVAAIIVLLTLVYNSWQSRKAAKQLQPNGGSSAFDKLTQGQTKIMNRLTEQDARLSNLESHAMKEKGNGL